MTSVQRGSKRKRGILAFFSEASKSSKVDSHSVENASVGLVVQVDVHHADVPAAVPVACVLVPVLVQPGGGDEITEITIDEPALPASHTRTRSPSPAVDDEPACGVESDHDAHTPQAQAQKRIRTSTSTNSKCRQHGQGFSKSWLAKFDWLTYNSVDNSMGCRLCRQQRCEGVWVSGTRNFRVKSLALHAASKVS